MKEELTILVDRLYDDALRTLFTLENDDYEEQDEYVYSCRAYLPRFLYFIEKDMTNLRWNNVKTRYLYTIQSKTTIYSNSSFPKTLKLVHLHFQVPIHQTLVNWVLCVT